MMRCMNLITEDSLPLICQNFWLSGGNIQIFSANFLSLRSTRSGDNLPHFSGQPPEKTGDFRNYGAVLQRARSHCTGWHTDGAELFASPLSQVAERPRSLR